MAEVVIRDELISAPRSSLNLPIGSRRRFRAVRMSLEDVKAVKTALGGRERRGARCLLGRDTRLLLERGEEPPHGLRAMVPLEYSGRLSQTLGLGNKITSPFVPLPVDEPDPMRR